MGRSRPHRRGGAVVAVAVALVFLGSALLAPTALPASGEIRATQHADVIVGGNGTNPIDHIIIVMQENHVYDTYFGDYCQGVGPYCDVNGTGIPPGTCVPLNPTNLSQGCEAPYLASPSSVIDPVDLVHDWPPAHEAYDNGSLDGFYQAEGDQLSTFMYYDGAEIPTYWDLAEEYGLGDNFFASVLSYSTPNHWYLVAGTSPPIGVNQTLHRSSSSSTKLTTDMEEYLNQANDTPTIATLLQNSSASWKYYDYALSTYGRAINAPTGAGIAGSAFDFWNPFASQAVSYTPAMKPHFVASSSFFTDAAAGNLPNVSWVLPTFNNSDHPPSNINNGEAWVDSIVNAVETSPDWNSSAIFITWDDYGGYYDNVPPPPLDANGVSFRAPLLVISPYAREGYISHQFTYFESLLHFIEWRYHLPSLTSRDKNAPLPLDYFDFNATPRAPMHINAPSAAVYPTAWQGLGAPRSPGGLTAAPGPASVTLNWTLSSAGAAVTTYQLTYGPSTAPTQSTVREDGSLTSVSISNLAPGIPYQFSLRSLTGSNASPAVASVAVPLSGTSSQPPGQPATWTSLPTPSGPSPAARSGAGFVYDAADHTDVLFGGQSTTGAYLGDTWEYYGGRWVQLATVHPPPARAFAGMAYDSTDGYVLLFGGVGAHGLLSDTWKFSAGVWTNLTGTASAPGKAPPARDYTAISDNPGASSVVMFGGYGAAGALGDTWRYAAGHWSGMALKTAPAARWGAAIAYDAKDGYPVLMGGASSTGSALNDTWRFSASTWHSLLTPASPGPRVGATMVYDATDQYVLLFGGNRSGTLVTGSWRFVGGGWVLLTPGNPPAVRQYASALYDGLHQGVLLGFGAGSSGALSGLSEFGLPMSLGMTSSPGYADAPVVETFFPTVAGGMVPYHYLWSFGDGTTSTLIDATHEYRIPGQFRIVLNVTDAVGATISASEFVTVEGPLGVVATADRLGPNGTVGFAAVVGGGIAPYRYLWTFGDGLPTSSTLADPTYQYNAPGAYVASVQVTDADQVTTVGTVNVVTDGGSLAVRLGANVSAGSDPLSVAFNASVPNGTGPYTYLWQFGDGTPGSNASAPVHLFTSIGTFVVSVNVSGSGGAWGTSFVSIQVVAPLTIQAGGHAATGGSDRSYQFTANVTGGESPYNFHWLFGDGNVSGGSSATHEFRAAGSYTVVLTVTDGLGQRQDVLLAVALAPPSTASAPGPAPLSVPVTIAPSAAGTESSATIALPVTAATPVEAAVWGTSRRGTARSRSPTGSVAADRP
jgi:phospholipase C